MSRILVLALAAIVFVTGDSCAETVLYEYDAIGQIKSVVNDDGSIIEYTYDGVGNRVRLLQSDGISAINDLEYMAVADFDGNQLVDYEDLALLRAAYGRERKSVCHDSRFDLNGDKLVDEGDVLKWFALCPGASWLKGDWTGAFLPEGDGFEDTAPDGVVNFWDLVVMTRYWGGAENLTPYREFLDISPNGVLGDLDPDDLELFANNWLTGPGPVPSVCIGSSAILDQVECASPGASSIQVRQSSLQRAGQDATYIDVCLLNAPVDLSCFQFTLSADLPLENTLSSEDDRIDEAALLLGLQASQQGIATGFLDLRARDGGWLISGAVLDAEPEVTGEETVLCSLLVPARSGRHEFHINDVLYGTSSGRVFSAESWTGKIRLLAVPERTSLSKSYPNPFNPHTTIKFAVSVNGPVKLRIYDIQGRLVRTLIDENLPAGWYENVWDGKDGRGRAVSSGTYFVRLQDRSRTLSQKMMLVR